MGIGYICQVCVRTYQVRVLNKYWYTLLANILGYTDSGTPVDWTAVPYSYIAPNLPGHSKAPASLIHSQIRTRRSRCLRLPACHCFENNSCCDRLEYVTIWNAAVYHEYRYCCCCCCCCCCCGACCVLSSTHHTRIPIAPTNTHRSSAACATNGVQVSRGSE